MAKRPVLHLGVFVQPYSNSGRTVRAVTTGDVAQWLENKYEIMGTFYKVHADDVFGPAIENSLEGSLESLLMGRAVDPWASAMTTIEQRFRTFISSREVERVGIRGTPTKAALKGINPRLKRGRGPRRPSFRAAGLYMNAFRAWVD
jgi:hypothetical protein